MSYILDALKKAERDRGIAKVPVLLAVHDLRPARRSYIWPLIGMLAACLAAAAWFGLSSRTPVSAPPQTGPKQNRAAGAADPEFTTPAPAPQTEVPPSVQPAQPVSVPQPRPALKTAASSQRLETAMTAPRGEGTQTVTPVQTDASPQPDQELMAVVPRVVAPAASARPAAGTPAAQPASTAVSPKTVSLRDALAAMNITVLVYAEGKADRLVFINGRKYAEGDYVDEIYLLESIRPDGAVLSHNGERAVLRPGPK